jgi:hypothetical protein
LKTPSNAEAQMRFVFKFSICVFALVSTAFCLPVGAAPLIAGSYYEDTVTAGCGNTTGCTTWFSQLPATQLLNVKRVNCRLGGMSQTPITYKFFVAPAPGVQSIGRNFFFRVGEVVSSGGSIYGAINDELNVLVGAGRAPAIEIDFAVASNVSINCTLIGELQNSQ